MKRVVSIVFALLLPVLVHAQEEPISRMDGFLRIWNSINRPAQDTSEELFRDVSERAQGARELRFAKARGIVDESNDNTFHPNDALTLTDALIWLFRTRSVADIDDMEEEDLPDLLARYPIASIEGHEAAVLTEEDLLTIMRNFDQMLRDEIHEISYYAEFFQGAGTAFGEKFNMHAITAAHRTFPYNTLVKVTNMDNGKSVTVRINDRGPYVHGRDMDLSLAAFEQITSRSSGVLRNVTFQRLGSAAMIGACIGNAKYQKRITRDVRFMRGVPHTVKLGKDLVLQSTEPFVVRGITYPDGHSVRIQDFVTEGEKFTFTPGIEGEYEFLLGTISGRMRKMRTNVVSCGEIGE